MNKEEILTNKTIDKFVAENKLSEIEIENNLDVFTDFIVENNLQRNNLKPVLNFENNQVFIAYKLDNSSNNKIFSIGIDIENFENLSLSDFEVTSQRKEVFTNVLKFTDVFSNSNNKFDQGLFISGNFGIGKTYLVSLLASNIANTGKKVAIANMTALIDRIRQQNSITEQRRLINRLINSDLLILDDFGAGHLTDFIRDEIIGSILEARMVKKMPIIFTSNFSINDLVDGYLSLTKNTIDLVKANRILERIKFLAREVKMGGYNRRN